MKQRVPLVATPEEVKALQAIRDKRLAGKAYKAEKTSFFKAFRKKYNIPNTSRIKIETEKEDRLGVVQWCGNNMPVRILVEVPDTHSSGL